MSLGEGILKIDVLIAEDEPGILASLDFILRRAGWSIHSVTDGQAALDAVKTINPKVLVLDVMLPIKSGFEVLKQLRLEQTSNKLPILILTAKGQEKDKELAKELGASAFITKPYANVDVIEAVRMLMDINKTDKRQS